MAAMRNENVHVDQAHATFRPRQRVYCAGWKQACVATVSDKTHDGCYDLLQDVRWW